MHWLRFVVTTALIGTKDSTAAAATGWPSKTNLVQKETAEVSSMATIQTTAT